MPRFFFHFRSAGTLTPDQDGEELSNAEAALAQARVVADQIQADIVLAGRPILGDQLEVHDASGTLVGIVPLGRPE